MRNIWKNDYDSTRCDWQLRQQLTTATKTVVTQLPASTAAPAAVVPTHPVAPTVPLIDAVVTTATRIRLHQLARRAPTTDEAECRQTYTIAGYDIPLTTRPKDLRHVQEQYDRYLESIHSIFCQQFWDIFLRVHTFPVNVIDTVLHAVKNAFIEKNTPEWGLFPTSRRAVLQKTGAFVEFWPAVRHTCRIDLTGILKKPLASGTRALTFEFLDPVWAWLSAARVLSPEELHWRPAAQSPMQAVYGGGVQYGECFRQACASCPLGGYPMCIGLHWDGTSGGGISSDPICIGVMNTNNGGAETQCCIGYMPQVPDQKRPEFSKTEACTKIKWHIRQECCRAILRVLEDAATKGVICCLYNRLGEPVDRLLFPRLVSMNFDQPEAQLFFGEPHIPPGCNIRVTNKVTLR